MFNKTKLYEVFLNKNIDTPLDEPILVEQGFTFFAFLLPPFWAIYNRAWELLALLILLVGVEIFITAFFAIPLPVIMFAKFLVSVWIGFEAANFKSRALESKNHVLYDVVAANNEILAKQRFYDKYLLPRN